jgi:hypothetical protein
VWIYGEVENPLPVPAVAPGEELVVLQWVCRGGGGREGGGAGGRGAVCRACVPKRWQGP